ncbi:MAG: hypothetical protein M3N06_02360 [Pseudomonadota bacterium]|jgi:hypothetical protein|nr:hypothetical protein [Pseudomonadota bacterium]
MLALLLFAASAAAAPATVAPVPTSAPNPRIAELFDREPSLMKWALKRFDANGDGWLTTFEAQRAADGFRDLADADHDGRVTTAEYRDAVAFIAARY